MFQDRIQAGAALAEAVGRLVAEGELAGEPVVLALPRGGVPVAFEVARRLSAPLDLVLVRKLGAPGQPELAAGAVVDGDAPQLVLNPDVIGATGMSEAEIEAARVAGLAEIARRRERYLAGRPPVPVRGRLAIVVDDGIATGATMRAALKALRRAGPAALVLAVPVAAAEALEDMRPEVDRIVCLEVPGWFGAVGMHYAVFDQTPDAEVIRLLGEAAEFAAGPVAGGQGEADGRE